MRAVALAAVAAALLAGCGVPQELPEQAEEVQSVAAEGALLARGAAAGETLDAFVRVHADALEQRLGQVRPAIDDRRLRRLADAVGRALERLAATPGDRARAGALARELRRTAAAAGRLGG